jgi:hypothetical protein
VDCYCWVSLTSNSHRFVNLSKGQTDCWVWDVVTLKKWQKRQWWVVKRRYGIRNDEGQCYWELRPWRETGTDMILGGEIGSERLVDGSERVGMMDGGRGKSGRKANGDNRQPDEGVVVREVFMQNAKKSRCESR